MRSSGHWMNEKKAAAMIGFAQKAGKAAGGEFAAEKAVRSGSAYLMLIATDASENTRKKFTNMAAWYHVPVYTFLSRTELGRVQGKGARACIVITDENFARVIEAQLKEEETE